MPLFHYNANRKPHLFLILPSAILSEGLFLGSAVDRLNVAKAVLAVKLDANGVVLGAAVEATALDDGEIGQDFEFGEEAAATVAAEEVAVDLARSPLGVVREGGALGHFKVPSVDQHVGGVGAAGPLVAVDAVAERCAVRLACRGSVNGMRWSASKRPTYL